MDTKTIMRIKPELTRFLHQFDDCFGRITTRRYLDLYVEGQLSDLPRKSIEPMADAFGEPPRNLQQFLSLFRWDEIAAGDRLQEYVARRHTHRHSVGTIDETTFAKKGDKTACVQRQHCGAVANSKTAWSVFTWGMRRRTSTHCWTGNCFCRKRPGIKIVSVASKLGFQKISCIGPSGKLLWNNIGERLQTVCVLPG